jgi:hypothetical protein
MSQIIEQANIGHTHVIEKASNKSFGLVFTAFFAFVGLWPVLKRHTEPRWWAIALATAFLTTTLIKADVLQPLNNLWMKFGALLAKIMNPIFLTIMFFGIITPAGLILRLFRKDLLSMRLDPNAKSYWVSRKTPDHEAGMKNQF